MDRRTSYLIIGNGIAGITAAEVLRAGDSSCTITIVADDPFPVYYRPALKDHLAGRVPEAKLWARPSTFYADQRVRFIPGRVVAVQPAQHIVLLQSGQQLHYDALLLANGARPRQLNCPGLDLAGVSTLRTVADYREVLRRLERTRRVVVCGSGTLALESAEMLNQRGYEVTHLLRQGTIWSEVLDATASDLVLNAERRAGIAVRLHEEIAQIVGQQGQVAQVITAGGARIPCDMVLIAIGIEPLTSFIRPAGIACGRGVKVDAGMRTNMPDIFAAGDIIETSDALTGRTRVLGQWYPAVRQARVAAHSMLGSAEASSATSTGVFYNATFLYGLDFVGLGLTNAPLRGLQEIVAEPQPQAYRKVVLRNGVPVGALLLGNREHALAFKRAIDARANLAPVAHRLFAADFDLDAWLDSQHVPPALLDPSLAIPSHKEQEVSPLRVQTVNMPAAGLPHNGEPEQPMDAFLIPVPHPMVNFLAGEVRLNAPDGSSIITIGRQAGMTLLLDHHSVSRQHAAITLENGQYVLRDHQSVNGTFVNNAPLFLRAFHVLQHHEYIRFGDVQFRFELRPAQSQPELAASRNSLLPHIEGSQLHASASRLIPEAVLASLPDMPALVLVDQRMTPRVVSLDQSAQTRLTLGRDSTNALVLDDPAASRRHAELFTAPDGFYVRDLESRNGVFVNSSKISNPYHLAHGDRVVVGNTLLYFSCPQPLTVPVTRANMGERASQGDGGTTTRIVKMSWSEKQPVARVDGSAHRANIQALNEPRIHFEIDMCIGCDRCMDACPVPMSSTIPIADLNLATISDKITPPVTRFTHECILCGSCVPVCPVDNHRDLLMFSLKQRLGPSWNEPANLGRVTEALPWSWTVPSLVARLREQAMLSDAQQVPENYLLHLFMTSQLVSSGSRSTLIREGEYGRDLYLILEGRVTLVAGAPGEDEFPVAVLSRGEYFGEDGMLTGQLYKVTARAQTTVLLLRVPEQVMQRLVELVPAVRSFFERVNSARSMRAMLKRLALFQGIADADMEALIGQARVKQYERNERLFAEDDRGGRGKRPARETLHLLMEGFVKVARVTEQGTERVIAYRQGGDYFAGGLDLLGDGRAVTVTSINRTRVAEVPRSALLALFQRYPEVEQRFALRLQEYLETTIAAHSDGGAITGSLRRLPLPAVVQPPSAGAQTGLHALVSDGVVEGTEVLVIDLDKCIHCDECEAACARRHGQSRMNRKGMVVDNISIATACRQCQDPVCMLCSRAGIARRPDGEVYITESCIGCGICAERCPYGAISIVDAEPPAHSQELTSWQRFSNFFTKESSKVRGLKVLPLHTAPGPLDTRPYDAYDEMRKKIAIKCDLCAGYSNQACVQACPTGAAIRVHPTNFFGSTEEILWRAKDS